MNKVGAALESTIKTSATAKPASSTQNKLVKLVKVDKDGRTISSELVSSSDADAIIKAQKGSQVQKLKSSSQPQPVTAKPVDFQALNRDIEQKNTLEKQLANQRVRINNVHRSLKLYCWWQIDD